MNDWNENKTKGGDRGSVIDHPSVKELVKNNDCFSLYSVYLTCYNEHRLFSNLKRFNSDVMKVSGGKKEREKIYILSVFSPLCIQIL